MKRWITRREKRRAVRKRATAALLFTQYGDDGRITAQRELRVFDRTKCAALKAGYQQPWRWHEQLSLTWRDIDWTYVMHPPRLYSPVIDPDDLYQGPIGAPL